MFLLNIIYNIILSYQGGRGQGLKLNLIGGDDKKNAPTDVSAIFLCKGYKKDIFGLLITGFELSYSITAEPCMESVTCYGMESMQSIVWNQAAGKYTFGDAIRLRQFHTRWRVMPYQACGLNATTKKLHPLT